MIAGQFDQGTGMARQKLLQFPMDGSLAEWVAERVGEAEFEQNIG